MKILTRLWECEVVFDDESYNSYFIAADCVVDAVDACVAMLKNNARGKPLGDPQANWRIRFITDAGVIHNMAPLSDDIPHGIPKPVKPIFVACPECEQDSGELQGEERTGTDEVTKHYYCSACSYEWAEVDEWVAS